MTLHEAIEKVLREKWMLKAPEIAKLINERGLYKRKDNKPLQPSQIHARINNYPELFYKNQFGAYELFENKNDGKSTNYKKLFKNIETVLLFSSIGNTYEKIIIVSTFIEYCKHSELLGKIINDEKIKNTFNPLLINNIKSSDKAHKLLLKGIGELLNHNVKINKDLWNYALSIIENISTLQIDSIINELSFYSFNIYDHSGILNKYGSLSDSYNEWVINFLTSSRINIDYTPVVISKIISKCINPNNGEVVFDMCSGSGLLLLSAIKASHTHNKNNVKFFGEEVNMKAYRLSQAVFEINLLKAEIFNSNSLSSGNFQRINPDYVITNPPFGQFLDYDSEGITHSSKRKNSIDVFVSFILEHLKSTGKAIIIVPEGFLTSGDKSLDIRTQIIEEDWLEKVISLPSGSFLPYSSVKTSIIVINKNKSLVQKNKVLFLNKDNELTSKGNIDLELLSEAVNDYSNTSDGIAIISNSQIIDNDYNLSSLVYVNPALKLLTEFENENKPLVLLRDVLLTSEEVGKKLMSLKIDLLDWSLVNHVIEVSDLIKPNNSPYIPHNKIDNDSSKILNKQIVHFDTILYCKFLESFNPSILITNNQSFAISKNIIPIYYNPEKIIPEFLVFELREQYVYEQLKQITKGASVQVIGEDSLMDIKIYCPEIKTQRRIANQKINDISLKLQSENISKEYTLLSTIKHSLSQQFGAFRNDIGTLKSFLDKTIDKGTTISWNIDVTPKTKLSDLFIRIDEDIQEADETLDKIKRLIELNKNEIQFNNIELVGFFKKYLEKYGVNEDDASIEIDSTGKAYKAYIDEFSFKELIRNLVENALKHGKIENEKIKIEFQFSEDIEENNLEIIYRDNGKGLPTDYTIDDLFKFGEKSGDSTGTGIGGNIIKKVLDLHNAKMFILNNDSFGLSMKIILPKNNN